MDAGYGDSDESIIKQTKKITMDKDIKRLMQDRDMLRLCREILAIETPTVDGFEDRQLIIDVQTLLSEAARMILRKYNPNYPDEI